MNTSSECEDIITTSGTTSATKATTTTTSGTTSATESGTETSTLSTETSTLTTTSSTTSVTNIADEDLCSWAINDYQKKTGVTPANAEITARSENACEITLTDENGNVLDVYTVDPKTGNRYRFFQHRSQSASDRKQLHDKLAAVRGCGNVHGIWIRCGEGIGYPQA